MKKTFMLLAAVSLLLASCASVPQKQKTAPAETPVPEASAADTPAVPQETPSVQETAGAAEETPVTDDSSVQDMTDAAPEAEPEAELEPIEEPVVRDISPAEESSEQPAASPTSPSPAAESSASSSQNTAAAKQSSSLPANQQITAQAKQNTVPPVKQNASAPAKQNAPSSVKKQPSSSPAKTSASAQTAEEETKKETAEPEKKDDKPLPSRTVTIDRNRYLDVVYPGTGWIYLGETDGTHNLIFFGRKLGETDTSFTLRAVKTGHSLLHFYKNDVLTGKYIDDYLEVNVTDTASDLSDHITAPSYADTVPPRPAAAGTEESSPENTDVSSSAVSSADSVTSSSAAPAETPLSSAQPSDTAGIQKSSSTEDEAPVKTVIQTAASSQSDNMQSPSADVSAPTSESAASLPSDTSQQYTLTDEQKNESADDLLKDAQSAYDAKEYEKADAFINLFFEKASSRIDEGLYLQGQILEAKSSVRNIKNAIDSYTILMKNWPESSLWDSARKRVIYLKRMYIDIR